MTRIGVALGLLTAVYLLVLGRASAWDVATGVAVAAAVLAGFRKFLRETAPGRPPLTAVRLLVRIAALPAFVLAVVVDIVHGTVRVAGVVLGLGAPPSPGIVEISVKDQSPRGAAVTALVTTMSPGSVLLELDTDRGVMQIQSIDAADPEAIRAQHADFYRRYQARVFP